MKLEILIIVIFAFVVTPSVALESEDIEINSTKIEGVEAYGSNNFTAEIEVLNDSEVSQIEKLGVGVYETIEINMDNHTQRVEFKLYENQSWAENYIKNNPSSFGGPTHIYSRGLFNMIEDDGLEHHPLRYLGPSNDTEGMFEAKVTESGIYYVVFRGTHADKGAYIGPSEECIVRYGYPGDEFKKVDNCVNNGENSFGKTIAYFAGIIILVFTFWKAVPIIRHKIILHRIDTRVEKLKKKDKIQEEELEKLYEAMQKAVDGNYRESKKIINSLSN